MAQTYTWGKVPTPEAVVQLERFAEFLMAHDVGPATQKMLNDMFEPGGVIRDLAQVSYEWEFRRITGGENALRKLLSHVKPALIIMEEKGYSPKVAEFRDFLTRLGEWDVRPSTGFATADKEVDTFIRRGFPLLPPQTRPTHKPVPPSPPSYVW